MKPIIFFVDDEPHNLTVFEAALPEEWDIYTFDNPMAALKEMEEVKPQVIVSDQRMPNVTGVQFLEIAKKVCVNAIRIIATGYSDEDLVVESVRKAQIFDYIKKPWDPNELEASIQRAIDFYAAEEEGRKLIQQLKDREAKLQKQADDLKKVTEELEASNKREHGLRQELECWVPPYVLRAVKDETIQFPCRKDIVGITYDIINSSKIHGIEVEGRPLRKVILEAFSELIMKHGGWRESHAGDSAYGHFGLLEDGGSPYESALAVAREFRAALKSIADMNSIEVECGVAVHVAENSIVDIHTIEIKTPRGISVQKSFDTSSKDIDLLHRMEALSHKLPGSNIIFSQPVMDNMSSISPNIIELGDFLLRGQNEPVHLFLLPSYHATDKNIKEFCEAYSLKSGKDSKEVA